jgi:disulfide bond formation protein DsbB
MPSLSPRAYAALAALASAAMLAAAHIFEHFGYEPCLLCLRQREVYWMALPLAAAGFVLLARRPDQGRVVAVLLAAVFLTGFAVAGYHAGVEWRWWPGPKTCAAGGAASAGEISAFLSGAKVPVLRCDEAAWRMLGLSMAGWNALASLGLAALGLVATGAPRPSARTRFARA